MRWIILFLLLSPFTLAAYEKWHFPGDEFEYNNFHYGLGYNNGDLLIRQDSELFNVQLNDCETTLYSEICFVDENFNLSQGYGLGFGRYNPETGLPEYSIKVKIDARAPNIVFSRSSYKNTPAINEPVQINTVIKNTGNVKAENIFFSELFFKNLKISSVNGALKDNKRVYLDLSILNKNYEHAFNYTLTPKSLLEDTSTSVLKYDYGGETFTVDITPISITVPILYSVSLVKPALATIEEEKTIIITIKNDDPIAELNISKLILTIPEIEVIYPEEITKQNNLYNWDGILESNTEKNFNFTISSRKIGSYPISLIYNLEVNEYSYSGEDSFNFEVDISKITPTLTLYKTNIGAVEPFNISLSLKNSNSELAFSNIVGVVTSEAFRPLEFNFNTLGPSEEIQVLNKQIQQAYPASGTIPVILSGTYKTYTGQILRFSEEKTLTVQELDLPFNVIIETPKTEFEKGEITTVKIKVIKGSTLTSLTLTHNEETKVLEMNESEIVAWNYNLTIQENTTLTTEMSFYIDNQEFKETFTKELIIKEIVKETEETETKKKVKETTSWLKGIINSFENFMRSIFS